LPTAHNPLTGKEWIQAIATEMGVEPKCRVVPKTLVWIIGMFMRIMKETVEMMYQYERDYIFDSSKFEKRFDFDPTPYREGIRNVVENDY
jgi:nucleoside-diphosphate-sugar epimerase